MWRKNRKSFFVFSSEEIFREFFRPNRHNGNMGEVNTIIDLMIDIIRKDMVKHGAADSNTDDGGDLYAS